ncbi:MAG: hypothetical protein HY290_25905 [Planctomycetia bacterium]|nr:hypothetical protein [Planctomycetia bacterium]
MRSEASTNDRKLIIQTRAPATGRPAESFTIPEMTVSGTVMDSAGSSALAGMKMATVAKQATTPPASATALWRRNFRSPSFMAGLLRRSWRAAFRIANDAVVSHQGRHAVIRRLKFARSEWAKELWPTALLR